MPDKYALWLVPTQPIFIELKELINELASVSGAVSFSPHITLATAKRVEQLHAAFRRDEELINVLLEVDDLFVDESLYTGFYLCFFKVLPIFELCAALGVSIARFEQHKEPHLSLLYREQSLHEKEKLAQAIMSKLPAVIECDRIQLWNVQGDVEDWRLMVERKLTNN